MNADEGYMRLALALAKRRKGLTHPNPTVGCVVVKNGEILGIGYHEGAGYPHAEVVALSQAGERARGSTVYVTLEPCVHFGKTPPCTDSLLRAGVSRVVIATLDPNELVSGRGVERLREKGIDVRVGVEEARARLLNEDFFTFVSQGRPFVTLKLAQTADGRIATLSGESKWISSIQSRRFAHRLRSEASAVLVGITTVLKDDPLLTVRHLPRKRQPLRIIIDPDLDIPLDSRLIKDRSAPTLVIFSKRKPAVENALSEEGVRMLYMEEINLRELLQELARRDIVHLLVEGGAYTVSRFIKEGLWDRLVLFQAPKLLGEGKGLEDLGVKDIGSSIPLRIRREWRIGEDRVFEYVPVMESPRLRW